MAEKSCNTCKFSTKSIIQKPCLECIRNLSYDNYTPMTNGDRIRQMSDEELAELIRCPHNCVDGCSDLKVSCKKCTLQWLREVAE